MAGPGPCANPGSGLQVQLTLLWVWNTPVSGFSTVHAFPGSKSTSKDSESSSTITTSESRPSSCPPVMISNEMVNSPTESNGRTWGPDPLSPSGNCH